MAITTTTDTAAIIEKRVSSIITETLIQESVALGSMSDFSSQVSEGMDRLDIPLFDALAIQDVGEATDLAPSSTVVNTAQLNLDRHKALAWSIGDKASVQSKANIVESHIRNGSRTMAAEVDDFMYGLVDSSSSVAAPDHRQALTADPLADMALAKKLLDDQNVPKAGRFIAASNGFVQALLGNSNVINVDKYGSENPIQAGFVSRVYGFTIVETSSASIIDDGFQAYHMDAYGFARQIAAKFERFRNVLGVRDEYALSHLYGGASRDPNGLRSVVFDADGI